MSRLEATENDVANGTADKAIERRHRLELLGREWAAELGCDLEAFAVGSNLHWALIAFQTRLQNVELAAYGLSMNEFITLWSVSLFERVPSLVLAAEVGLAKSSMTGMVDRLAERGLVTRTRDPEDGRSMLVGLTDCGAEVVAAAFQSVNRVSREMTAGMTATDKNRLASALRQMADRCDDVEGVTTDVIADGVDDNAVISPP